MPKKPARLSFDYTTDPEKQQEIVHKMITNNIRRQFKSLIVIRNLCNAANHQGVQIQEPFASIDTNSMIVNVIMN
jgi:hypothetical protein